MIEFKEKWTLGMCQSAGIKDAVNAMSKTIVDSSAGHTIDSVLASACACTDTPRMLSYQLAFVIGELQKAYRNIKEDADRGAK